MRKFYRFAGVVVISVCLLIPSLALAQSIKTFTGTVTKINGSTVTFTNSTAATYSAEIGNAALARKNGAVMQTAEILVGDKVEVKGTLWSDNSINASVLRDMSLYAHNSSFTGKIIGLNPLDSSFTMQSKTYGMQTVHTDNFSSFSKNTKSATYKDLELGMTATVKAIWDRSYVNILAKEVKGTLRYISIYFTGNLSAKNGQALTVIGNGNVIYGVDVSQAVLQSKNTKTLVLSELNTGDTVRIWGKHVSGSVQIFGSKVKDSSITK